jgi:hypothetical protein
MSMKISVFARTHAKPGKRDVALPHTVRFVGAAEPLLDHPLKVTLSEQLW